MALKNFLKFLAVISFVFVIVIFSLYVYNFAHLGLSSEQEVWAQFGDFIGGILNPILAFMGLIALLYTIKLQSDALQMSKDELMATREELARSAKAQQEQSESLKLQNEATQVQIFESTFFELLKQHNNYLELMLQDCNIDYVKFDTDSIGRDFVSESLEKKEIANTFKKLNNEKRSIKNYFMILYQILKFIDEKSTLHEIDENFYTNITRSLIDDEVLRILAINCISYDFSKYKEYIEKYQFFEHIYIEKKEIETETILLILSEFNLNAFGKNENLIKIIQQ